MKIDFFGRNIGDLDISGLTNLVKTPILGKCPPARKNTNENTTSRTFAGLRCVDGVGIYRIENVFLPTRLSTTEKLSNLSDLREQARSLLNNRCVICLRPTRVVHEVLPRSSGLRSLSLDNMVLLCQSCHENVHQLGPRKMSAYLLACRQRALKILGKESK